MKFFIKLRERLRSESGVFDLPSVMVASLISVILIGALTVSIIGIARVALENGAKNQLNAMVLAQKTFFTGNDRYATPAEITAGKLFNFTDDACLTSVSPNTTYRVVAEAQPGLVLYIDSSSPTTVLTAAAGERFCLPS